MASDGSVGPVQCEGCYWVQPVAPGCALPTGWAWVTLDKCWEAREGISDDHDGQRRPRKRGEVYCYAQKVMCSDCLKALQLAYRAVRRERGQHSNRE